MQNNRNSHPMGKIFRIERKFLYRPGRFRLALFSFLMLLLVSLVYQNSIPIRTYGEKDLVRFQRALHEKEALLESFLNELSAYSHGNISRKQLFDTIPLSFFNRLESDGLAFAIYYTDSLVFWSENGIPLPEIHEHYPFAKFLRIGNAYYVCKERVIDKAHIEGLILIKQDFPYENRYLKNSFQKDFSLPGDVPLSSTRPEGKYPVYSTDGNYLFNLDFEKSPRSLEARMMIGAGLYGLLLISLLVLFRECIKIAGRKNKPYAFIATLLLLAGLYAAMNFFRFPELLFRMELFSPAQFAWSAILPSLGDLFVLSVFFFFLVYIFYREFTLRIIHFKGRPATPVVFLTAALLITIAVYFINAFVFKSLILDSSISFEPYKVLDLTVFSFIGYMIMALLFASYCLIIDKVLMILTFNRKSGFIYVFLGSLYLLMVGVLMINLERGGSMETTLFFAFSALLIWYTRVYNRIRYTLSTFIGIIFLFAFFTVFEVVKYSGEKSRAEMKMMAVSLSTEHDPIAELLFLEINPKLVTDNELISQFDDRDFQFNEFYTTIQRKYFSGYFDKYDLQVTLCGTEDSVYVSPPEDSWYHCYNFFYEYILAEGIQVPNTDFYFLNNLSGRISYFAAIRFNDVTGKEVAVFIELDSKPVSEGLGYPELLLEERYAPSGNDFSFAKYSRGQLITASGDFAYSTSDSQFRFGEGFTTLRMDKYEHMIYNIDGSSILIVSKPSVFWVDILISFSYIFGFYALLLIVLLLLADIIPLGRGLQWDFKNKIQLSMTSILLFSLILIGSGTVYFSISQYRNRQIENLQEKIQSVYVELIHKLEYENDLHNWSTDQYYNLDALLQKFSNVFYSDINLFDGQGRLLATSRPEIFNKGLLSIYMDPSAFKEMEINRRSEYIHREVVGELSYLSAYVPFVNAENKLLAYLNLPYFTRQYELTREITNLVVAIINIVVLLSLLSFSIAVFLSNRITQPLRLLQENMSKVSLGGNNVKIQYQGKDEIGTLVKQYNQMVDELQQSAGLLAKSERESAWREMARQIAHEIKNPLTPMRLGLQHLQRISRSKPEELEEMVEKLSTMLVEQIDHLSSIATEFSNFAKMPPAKIEKIDLVLKINNLISLFSEYENFTFTVNQTVDEKVYVYFDREQLNRVFINLIKNAIQSVPEGRPGKIEFEIETTEELAIVSIKDNGKGISDENRKKMFQPNFTTKTSGMGLGLAIVKSILENSGGRVYYHSEQGNGSIFYVELPLYPKDIKSDKT
jgi:nitrogen fixation/metabolism regulation signal transduction histidine kinase